MTPAADDVREGGLLKWQWRGYPEFHRDRRNLAIHLATAPLFWSGLISLGVTPLVGVQAAWGGLLLLVPLILQGRGHKLEGAPPLPFRGPFDVVARFTLEQLVNFPRFVVTGGWSKAWAEAGAAKKPA